MPYTSQLPCPVPISITPSIHSKLSPGGSREAHLSITPTTKKSRAAIYVALPDELTQNRSFFPVDCAGLTYEEAELRVSALCSCIFQGVHTRLNQPATSSLKDTLDGVPTRNAAHIHPDSEHAYIGATSSTVGRRAAQHLSCVWSKPSYPMYRVMALATVRFCALAKGVPPKYMGKLESSIISQLGSRWNQVGGGGGLPRLTKTIAQKDDWWNQEFKPGDQHDSRYPTWS